MHHATAERSGGAHPLDMVSGLTLAITMVEPIGRVVHTFWVLTASNSWVSRVAPVLAGFGTFCHKVALQRQKVPKIGGTPKNSDF